MRGIYLGPLFDGLILVKRDPLPSPAAFSINSTNIQYVTSLTSSYYLDGTVVGLCISNTPTYRFVLASDISYAFDTGMWRSTFSSGGKDNSTTAKSFVSQAAT